MNSFFSLILFMFFTIGPKAFGSEMFSPLSRARFRNFDKTWPLNSSQSLFLEERLGESLLGAMSRSIEIFERQRLEGDVETSIGPNCFWFAFAWHVPVLREKPRPVNFMIEASRIETPEKVRVDLRDYEAPDHLLVNNDFYEIDDTLNLSPKWLQAHFESVEIEEAKAGDIFLTSVIEKGFNYFPSDYESYLEELFEFLPFKFYTEARLVAHAALYLGENWVFQKDAITTEGFTLMKVESALMEWREKYSHSRIYHDDFIEVSDYNVALFRPKASFIKQMDHILK